MLSAKCIFLCRCWSFAFLWYSVSWAMVSWKSIESLINYAFIGQLVLDRQSLDSQQYYCFNEELVFTCSAPGTAIQWDAPPVFNGEGFLDIQTVPRSRNISGVNGTVYLQQGMPTFVTTLRIRNVRDITVQCSTNAPFSSSLSLTTSSKQWVCIVWL